MRERRDLFTRGIKESPAACHAAATRVRRVPADRSAGLTAIQTTATVWGGCGVLIAESRVDAVPASIGPKGEGTWVLLRAGSQETDRALSSMKTLFGVHRT